MKGRILIVLLLQMTILFGEYNDYEMEKVHTFEDDYKYEDLMTEMSGLQDNGPSAFNIAQEGNLYINDSLTRRRVKFDQHFNYIEEYTKEDRYSASRISIKDELVF